MSLKKIIFAIALGTITLALGSTSAKAMSLDEFDYNTLIIGDRVFELNEHLFTETEYDDAILNNASGVVYYKNGFVNEDTDFINWYKIDAGQTSEVSDITTVFPNNELDPEYINGIRIVGGIISQDPAHTGGNVTTTVLKDTITFDGTIDWYEEDLNLGREAGNYVGIQITAPIDFDTTNSTVSFNGETYNWEEIKDGNNYLWLYPEVTASLDEFVITVVWDENNTQVFTIKIAETAILGNAKIDLSSIIEGKSNTFLNTYYNKFSNQIFTEVDDSIYYITLGTYTGLENPTSLTIGSATYGANALELSIGKNSKINVPVWKIKDGKVMIALPWLNADALPNQATNVTVGGQTFEVNVFNNSVAGNVLTLDEAGAVNKVNGYIASVSELTSNSVKFTYSHKASSIGVKLSLGGVSITDPSQIIFRKAPNGSMGMTTPESGYTYVLYPSYANAPVTEARTFTKEYKIALPGKGVIGITFNCEEIVEPVSEPVID